METVVELTVCYLLQEPRVLTLMGLGRPGETAPDENNNNTYTAKYSGSN